MNDSFSDEDFQADRMINRSCNQKIQDDSLQSELPQAIKFKATRSQNELNTLEGETAMDVLSQQWKKNEKNKQKKEKNRVQTNRTSNRNSPTNKRNPQFFQVGTDLVNSEEISIDDDFLRSEDHIERSQNSRKHTTQQMKIIEERRKKEMQQLITLNILTLGKSGVGKSSFIQCFSNKNYENSPVIRSKTQIMNIVTVRNQADNFQVKLIDMPGYEETKVQQYLKDVENLINKRFQAHLKKISDRKSLRSEIKDERIHCCLYFLSGPWVCESDWIIMKRIENITNIIPIVAKGDTFTTRQIKEFKKKILERNKSMNVSWFSIEEYLRSYHPDKLKALNEGTFGKSPPFVITCCTEKQYNQKTRKHQLVRDFRWGKCQLNNESHNDYKFLKSLLLYYLSDLLIKTTDLTMRGYQQRMIQNRIRTGQSRSDQNARSEQQIQSSISQSQDLLNHQGQFMEIVRTYVQIGLTLVSLIGVYYWVKRNTQ